MVEYTGTIEDRKQGGMLNRTNWKPTAIQDAPCGFDMTFAEIDGTGYYIWPSHCQLHIQKVDPIDPTKLIGEATGIKSIEWPFEYGKHKGLPSCNKTRRSSIQVARLDVVDGVLVCDRDEEFELDLQPENT